MHTSLIETDYFFELLTDILCSRVTYFTCYFYQHWVKYYNIAHTLQGNRIGDQIFLDAMAFSSTYPILHIYSRIIDLLDDYGAILAPLSIQVEPCEKLFLLC